MNAPFTGQEPGDLSRGTARFPGEWGIRISILENLSPVGHHFRPERLASRHSGTPRIGMPGAAKPCNPRLGEQKQEGRENGV